MAARSTNLRRCPAYSFLVKLFSLGSCFVLVGELYRTWIQILLLMRPTRMLSGFVGNGDGICSVSCPRAKRVCIWLGNYIELVEMPVSANRFYGVVFI